MEQAAVIILNFNGLHFLKQFLPSVAKFSIGHRVIVADNSSTDASLAFLQENYPQVEIIAFQENYGFAKGYDEALKQIDNKYSILLNSDVEVTENWINPIIEFMETDDKIAACQPKIRAYHQKDTFEHAGAAGGFIDILGYPFCRGRIFDTLERDDGQYDDIRKIFWATGACFFVKTKIYQRLGGLDPIFHAHMEEIDFCWRVNAAGYHVYFYPKSIIYHVGGGTMPASNPRKTYLNFRNSTGVLYKNVSSKTLWWKIPAKILIDLLAAVKFVASGKIKDAQAVILGNFHFLANISKWHKRREVSKALVPGKINKIIYPGILVFERYLKQRKRFSQLRF